MRGGHVIVEKLAVIRQVFTIITKAQHELSLFQMGGIQSHIGHGVSPDKAYISLLNKLSDAGYHISKETRDKLPVRAVPAYIVKNTGIPFNGGPHVYSAVMEYSNSTRTWRAFLAVYESCA